MLDILGVELLTQLLGHKSGEKRLQMIKMELGVQLELIQIAASNVDKQVIGQITVNQSKVKVKKK